MFERCCRPVLSEGPGQLLCREKMVAISPASVQPRHFTDDWLMASTNELAGNGKGKGINGGGIVQLVQCFTSS